MISPIRHTILHLAKQKSRLYVIWFFIIQPFGVALLPFFISFKVNDNGIAGNIISGLSLFIGFFFSLIFVVSDRVQLKKDELQRMKDSSSDEEIDRSSKAKLNAYIQFGQRLVRIISTTVYVSLILIVLMLVSQLELINDTYEITPIVLKIIQFINCYLGTVLLFLILYVLREMYDFFYGQLGDSSLN